MKVTFKLKYSYQVNDKMYLLENGEKIGEVNPKFVNVFLTLFKGGEGRFGAWSGFVDFYKK